MRKVQNAFSHEYDKSSIIKTQAANFNFSLTPRFLNHYKDNGAHYEPYSLKVFLSYCTEGSFAIDIGAHYGFYTLSAARAVGKTGKIISCEPINFNKFVLDKNIKDNKFDTFVSTLNVAVSDRTGTAEFKVTEASDNAGFYDHPNTKILETIRIKTMTLDNIAGDKKPAIIKIDVEGHENEVLAGASKTIKQKVPLFLEFNPKCFTAAGHKPEEVLVKLKSSGYKLYLIDENKQKKYRLYSARQWKLHMKKMEYRNILAV